MVGAKSNGDTVNFTGNPLSNTNNQKIFVDFLNQLKDIPDNATRKQLIDAACCLTNIGPENANKIYDIANELLKHKLDYVDCSKLTHWVPLVDDATTILSVAQAFPGLKTLFQGAAERNASKAQEGLLKIGSRSCTAKSISAASAGFSALGPIGLFAGFLTYDTGKFFGNKAEYVAKKRNLDKISGNLFKYLKTPGEFSSFSLAVANDLPDKRKIHQSFWGENCFDDYTALSLLTDKAKESQRFDMGEVIGDLGGKLTYPQFGNYMEALNENTYGTHFVPIEIEDYNKGVILTYPNLEEHLSQGKFENWKNMADNIIRSRISKKDQLEDMASPFDYSDM